MFRIFIQFALDHQVWIAVATVAYVSLMVVAAIVRPEPEAPRVHRHTCVCLDCQRQARAVR